MSDMQCLIQTALNQLGQHLLNDLSGVEAAYGSQWLRSQLPYGRLPMPQLDEGQVSDHALEVFGELRHKARNIQVGVNSVRKGEIVGLGQDLDTVREIALPAHTFLEGRTRCSPTIDFSVEKGLHYKLGREGVHIGLHNIGRISSSKTPYNIARSVSYMSANTVSTSVDIIY